MNFEVFSFIHRVNITLIKQKLQEKAIQFSLNREDFSNSPYNVICATLDKRGSILSIGFNSYTKTHTLQKHYATKVKLFYKEYLHAEISALVKTQNKVHSVMVLRVTQTGKIANAKPCPVCMMALVEAGVKTVFYSNQDESMEYLSLEYKRYT